MTIPSPYYFVPLASEIFFPDWAAQVSMDVPFRDGISGCFAVRITAETPIYTRNGGAAPKDDPEYNDFFRVYPETGEYAINGPTFKGMIRNIVEIASFGKFALVDADEPFAFRDLNLDEYKDKMTTTSSFEPSPGIDRSGRTMDATCSIHETRAKAGFLEEDAEGRWWLYPCEFVRVEIEHLQDIHPDRPDLFSKQSANEKYHKWEQGEGGQNLEVRFNIEEQTDYDHGCSACRHDPRRLWLRYKKAKDLNQPVATQCGRIVFTGQPAARRGRGDRHKKHMEFIFYTPAGSIPDDPVLVDESVKESFRLLHKKPSDPEKSNEWYNWPVKLGAGEEVPIFYLPDPNGNPTDIGLAMMFRLPYKYRIRHLIQNVVRPGQPGHLDAYPVDLAETILGRASGQTGLRGRVTVEPLLQETEYAPDTKVETALNTPQSTYYPNYIKQDANAAGHVTHYKTYNNKDAQPSGWKKIPVARPGSAKAAAPPQKEKQRTTFCPLPAGATFYGIVHVHNLRVREFGAILWALTWGGRSNLRHNIGMAKPYGFGTIRIEVIDIRKLSRNDGAPVDLSTCMNDFVNMMRNWKPTWECSPQLRELLAMADPCRHDPAHDHLRAYPVLDPDKDRNDFKTYKGNNRGKPKFALRLFTEQTR